MRYLKLAALAVFIVIVAVLIVFRLAHHSSALSATHKSAVPTTVSSLPHRRLRPAPRTSALPATTISTAAPPPTTSATQAPRPIVRAANATCPSDIASLVYRYMPGDADWWFGIIQRESRCQPGAANLREVCHAPTDSHAYGLTETCLPLHADMYAAVGCAPWETHWMQPACNLAAAAYLESIDGKGPWNG